MSRYFFVFSLFVFVLLTGCSTWITPSRMYKPERDAVFSSPEAILKIKEHIITIDDELIVYVYANTARDLINPEFARSSAGAPQHLSYRVRQDGTVNLPGLGVVTLSGKTLSEAEAMLTNEYKSFINNPFVVLKVVNKRVFVHRGAKNSGAAVVDLENPNATLIEAITKSGGIIDGRSCKIYLIRGKHENIKMYELDLSAADNSHLGNIVLQSDDIIYISPQLMISRRLLEEVTPILTLATTALLVLNLFK
jgi:polysaccharide biosynthesis/export protein